MIAVNSVRNGGREMKKLFGRLGRSIHHYAKWWIGAIVLITVFLTLGLPQIQMKMGNDVFVNPSRAIYQNSRTYQKHFGGDSLYLLLNGSRRHVINHRTMLDLARFSHRVKRVKNVTSTTSVVNLVNSELKHQNIKQMRSSNVNQTKLKRDLLNSLPKATQARLQKQVQASLTGTQKKQLQQYTLTQLTSVQKRRLQKQQTAKLSQMSKQAGNSAAAKAQLAAAAQSPAAQQQQQAQQQAAVQQMLTKAQRAQIEAYTMTILRPAQQKVLLGTVIKHLPKVQNMSTALLRDIFLQKNGNVQKPLRQFFPRNGHHVLMVMNTSSKSSDMSVDVQLSKDVKHAIRANHFNGQVQPKLAGQPHILGQVQGAVI